MIYPLLVPHMEVRKYSIVVKTKEERKEQEAIVFLTNRENLSTKEYSFLKEVKNTPLYFPSKCAAPQLLSGYGCSNI